MDVLLSIANDAIASSSLELHGRVRLRDGREGVIRHLGSVHWAPGDYVGVELSKPDAEASSHEGTVGSVHYFSTQRAHTGTFVRPSDVVHFEAAPPGASSVAVGFESRTVRSPSAPTPSSRALAGGSLGARRAGGAQLTGSMWSRSVAVQKRAAAVTAASSAAAAAGLLSVSSLNVSGGGAPGLIPLEVHRAQVSRYEAEIAALRAKLAQKSALGATESGDAAKGVKMASSIPSQPPQPPPRSSPSAVLPRFSPQATLRPSPPASPPLPPAPQPQPQPQSPLVASEPVPDIDPRLLLLQVTTATTSPAIALAPTRPQPMPRVLPAAVRTSTRLTKRAPPPAAAPTNTPAPAAAPPPGFVLSRASFTYWSSGRVAPAGAAAPAIAGNPADDAAPAPVATTAQNPQKRGRSSATNAAPQRPVARGSASIASGMRAFVQGSTRTVGAPQPSHKKNVSQAGDSLPSASTFAITPAAPRAAAFAEGSFSSPGFVPPPRVVQQTSPMYAVSSSPRPAEQVIVSASRLRELSSPPPPLPASPRSSRPQSSSPRLRPSWNRPTARATPSPPVSRRNFERGGARYGQAVLPPQPPQPAAGGGGGRVGSVLFAKMSGARAVSLNTDDNARSSLVHGDGNGSEYGDAPLAAPSGGGYGAALFAQLENARASSDVGSTRSSAPHLSASDFVSMARAAGGAPGARDASSPLAGDNAKLATTAAAAAASSVDATPEDLIERLRSFVTSTIRDAPAASPATSSPPAPALSRESPVGPTHSRASPTPPQVLAPALAEPVAESRALLAAPKGRTANDSPARVADSAAALKVSMPVAPPTRRPPPPPPAPSSSPPSLSLNAPVPMPTAPSPPPVALSPVPSAVASATVATSPQSAVRASPPLQPTSAEPSVPSPSSLVSRPGPSSPPAAKAAVRAFVRAYAGLSERGCAPDAPEKPCQDAVSMLEAPGGAFDCVFFGVFDGHGEAGADVAEFLRDAVPKAFFASPLLQDWVAVSDNIPRAGTPGASATDTLSLRASARAPLGPTVTRRNVAGALRAALLDAERALLARSDIDCALAGSTACIAVVSDIDHLTVANVGDSRAVLLRRDAQGALVADGVTVDHKPTLPGETRRILLKGGRVHALSYDDGPDGPVRVWLGREDSPGLAMSRSVGDTVGKRAGVSSEPDVYTATLEPGADALLVLATDGLWEFCSGDDVAYITAKAEEAAMRATVEAAGAGPDALPPPQLLQLALDALVDEATSRWQANDDAIDDISIIMAEIGVQSASK